MIGEDINESDEYVSDEELAQEMDIPEPPQSPSLEKCGICPFKSYNADPDESTITLKRKRALENCNYWAKRRKMNIQFKVITHNSYLGIIFSIFIFLLHFCII